MATQRKRHPHPRLIPPRTLWKRWYSAGISHKERVKVLENDEGKVIDGRVYSYHPTKGWRSRNVAA